MKSIFPILLALAFGMQAQSRTASMGVADSLYGVGDFTQAINYYATVGSPKASLQIARAYNAIGNFDKAVRQYEAVVSKDTSLQLARFELGKLYLKTKRFDAARKTFSYLVNVNKNNPEYRYYQGEVFQELDQVASSLVAYKKAVALDSTHLRSLFRLGKHYTVKRERDAALNYVDQGLRFYENDVALLNLKALILYNDDQFENAIPWFEKVLQLGEKKEYIYSKLAYCYHKNWEFEKAKNTYGTLLAMDDTQHDPHFGLGNIYVQTKQLDSAEFHYKKAIALQQPVLVREYYALANLSRMRNDLKSALAYYRLAYEEDTSSSLSYYHICTVADQYYDDPKVRLEYYTKFIEKFGEETPYLSQTVHRRIRELKEEVHFNTD